MKKQILLLNLMFSVLILFGQSNNERVKELILQEDGNVKITLWYFSKADIGDADWLKVEIENKTDSDIQIVKAQYYLNNERLLKNGEKYINIGGFGRGSKSHLMHNYYIKTKPPIYKNDIVIKSGHSILGWKYLSNYAAALIEGRKIRKDEIYALFQMDFRYKLKDKEIKLVCDNKPFSFKWAYSDAIDEKKLENRLREIILNPHYKLIDYYVTKPLMELENIVSRISTEDLIQGVILREDVSNDDENILFLKELNKRNAIPNESLTRCYRKRISEKNEHLTSELQFYWDDVLLADLLNSKFSYHLVHKVLEINAKSWSTNPMNKKMVYEYFAKSLDFEKTDYFQYEKISEWADNVKMISTSREVEFIKYLESFLEYKREFKVEDWSKYRMYGYLPKDAKPDIITLRVCDVAFVALLNALNQFDFSYNSFIGTRYHSFTLSNEILSSEMIGHFAQLLIDR